MILFFTGENTFEVEQDINQIIADFDGIPERIDGSELNVRDLPDLMTGSTLFSDKRLVIIKALSENKAIWPTFSDWVQRISDDITLILVDAKPDKRTVTYKELKKVARLVEYAAWTDRDEAKASAWTAKQAELMGVKLNTKSVQMLIRRIGPNQWGLLHALEKLALVDVVTDEIIESVIDARPSENVFSLFDAALQGDRKRVSVMIRTLELTEDPYQLFGLLSGQAFQLATLAVAGSTDAVASDLGVSPYVISKLSFASKKLGRSGARKIVRAFAVADDDIKLSRGDPWMLIERALMHVDEK